MSDTVSDDGYVYTEEEMKVYSSERAHIYKGTITICAIYSVIAFLLIIIGYFTEWGRNFLLGTILPFIITYIIGSIVVIIILADWVSKYKPRRIDDRDSYDNDICPDYWKLEQVTDEDIGKMNFSSNVNINLMKYKCVMDKTVLDSIEIANSDPTKYKFTNSDNNTIYGGDNNSHLYVNANTELTGYAKLSKDTKLSDFKDYAAYMINYEHNVRGNNDYIPLNDETKSKIITIKNATGGPIPINKTGNSGGELPLTCDTVYPLYLSAMDLQNADKNKGDDKNIFRCAYSKACGVPWTEAGCVEE